MNISYQQQYYSTYYSLTILLISDIAQCTLLTNILTVKGTTLVFIDVIMFVLSTVLIH